MKYVVVNSITACGFCIGLLGCSDPYSGVGICLLLVSVVLDCLDGFVARAWQAQSWIGERLDWGCDAVIALCLAWQLPGDYGYATTATLALCQGMVVMHWPIKFSGRVLMTTCICASYIS